MNPDLTGAWRVYARTAVVVLAGLFSVGAAGHVVPSVLPLMLLLTPWFLLLNSALVAAPALADGGGRLARWMLAAYGFTFLVEAAGVASGAIFGAYAYGPTLGWAWHGVPLIIAFNWVMVVHGAVCLAGRVVPVQAGRMRTPAIVALTGVLATAFDFLLEPVAIRLDYWTWAGGAIPLQNYAAWFVIAALMAAVHPRRVQPSCALGTAGRLAGAYVALQALFFLALRLMWHFGAA